MALRLAFVLNPIAGMGGSVGLKGTDGVLEEALRRGASPVAPGRAARFLARLQELLASGALAEEPEWLAAGGAMGAGALREGGWGSVRVVHEPANPSTAEDTVRAVRAALAAGAEAVVFCGGDGTARDVVRGLQGTEGARRTGAPILGIPAGVKLHSAVFAVGPEAAADLLAGHAQGFASIVEGEVLDVDEEAYRRGEWRVRLYALAPTLDEPMLRQSGKLAFEEVSDEEEKGGLAAHVEEFARAHPRSLFLLGPGSTLEAVARRLGVAKTLLGFDAWQAGKQVGADLGERGLLALLDAAPDAWLLLSPIGAQGFVLGRGNQQASPAVVRRVGLERLLILATPRKLRATPLLRVDSGDAALDAEARARGHWPVVIGYRTLRLVPVA